MIQVSDRLSIFYDSARTCMVGHAVSRLAYLTHSPIELRVWARRRSIPAIAQALATLPNLGIDDKKDGNKDRKLTIKW